ncbi:MAG: hypothetical protein ACRC37_00355, partial [Lentisphaeria bacterium]
LVDRENGKIYILDQANAERYSNGQAFSPITTETAIIQASVSNGHTEGGSTGTGDSSGWEGDEQNSNFD